MGKAEMLPDPLSPVTDRRDGLEGIRVEEIPLLFTYCNAQESRPCTLPGHIVELALMAKAQMRNPEGMRESRRVDPASWQLQSPVS